MRDVQCRDQWMEKLGKLASAPVAGVLLGGALALFAPACVDSDGQSGPDWSVGDDAGGDGGTSDVGPPDEPLSTTIRLENAGSRAVWVRPPKSQCQGESPGWVTLREDGEEKNALDSCGTCNCDTLRSDRDCAVCSGAPCVGGGEVNQVAAGETVEWTWRGRFYRQETVDGQTCESPYIPRRDASLSAEICWNPAPDSPTEDSIRCDTVAFEYGEEKVTKTVRPGSNDDPVETTFVLHNESDNALQVTNPSPCRTGEKPWVGLRDGEIPVDFETDCTTCSCSDVGSGGCPVCEKGCVPSATRIQAGASVDLTWDGVGHRREQVDGHTCHREWVPERGDKLTARFCFAPDDPTLDAGKDCRNVQFLYGEKTRVEYTYDSESREPPYETEFVLKNGTNTTVRVEQTGCDEDGVQWLELKKGGATVDPATDCTDCSCSEVRETGNCAVCGRPCEPGIAYDDVDPGDQVSWTWPGHLYEDETVDGMMCQDETTPSFGTSFTAEFQWYPEGARGTVGTSQGFQYGETTRIVERVE